MWNQFQKSISLSKYSSFGIGGAARYFAEVSDIEKMQEVLRFCYQESLPFHIVGKGSNSLFDDAGFDGLVILNKISFCTIEDCRVSVGAGFSFSLLGSKTARKGLSGLEFASGIPATVGGAIFMNAGANGFEVKDCLQKVSFVDARGALNVYTRDELDFSYRWSCFHEKKGAIVAAEFLLTPRKEAREEQLRIIEYRTKTQPYSELSCGCVFKNPEGDSAGRLIEACGLKGAKVGGAEVSSLHGNFIINTAAATASDVLKLAEHVKTCVKQQTGVDLELELRKIF